MSKVDAMALAAPQRACTPFVLSTSDKLSAELAVVVSTGLWKHERTIDVHLLRILPIHIPPSGIIVGEHSCSLRGSPVRQKSQPAVRYET